MYVNVYGNKVTAFPRQDMFLFLEVSMDISS